MKTSLKKVLILATAVAMLLAALAPAASASSRGELRLAADAGETKHEICILEGANICPPEPFENIVICITTSMLAGSECPHMHDDKDDGKVGTLVAVGRN